MNWKRLLSMARLAATLICLLALAEREARAYADPGSGAMLWQMLVAAAVGALFYFRKFVRYLTSRSPRKHQ
jgi:hypothetical protein